jgi:peptidoglycan/LPS O-acetylase OafA/YrhL
LITGILLDSKGQGRFFRNFYARRFLRIFPLYYAMLIFSLVLLGQILMPALDVAAGSSLAASTRHQAWYWFYLVNWYLVFHGLGQESYLDIAWSLSIEEQFYLVWPLVVWILWPRAMGWLCGLLIVAAVVLRPALLAVGTMPVTIKMSSSSYVDSVALGALLALTARSPLLLRRCAAAAPWILGAAVVAFFVVWLRHPGEWSFEAQAIGMPLAAFASAALVIGAYANSPGLHWLAWAPLRFFGRYSYAMYLLHLPLQILTRGLFDPNAHVVFGNLILAQFLFYILCTSWTLLAALLSWHLLERPCLSLKRYFVDDKSGAARDIAALTIAATEAAGADQVSR